MQFVINIKLQIKQINVKKQKIFYIICNNNTKIVFKVAYLKYYLMKFLIAMMNVSLKLACRVKNRTLKLKKTDYRNFKFKIGPNDFYCIVFKYFKSNNLSVFASCKRGSLFYSPAILKMN